MPNWNPMQQKAIETRRRNILVSASAGSGKTTVLIARLMDLVLKERIGVDAILAMTFTEAAANEMKKRLAAALQEAMQKTQEEAELAYIRTQLTALQTANISTIHSFCLSILQDHYYVIGLDGERIRHVMDNGMMEKTQRKALEAALQKQYEQNDAIFVELSIMFSARAESEEMLWQTIRSLATLASSRPDPQQWLQDACKDYQDKQRIEDLPEHIYQAFWDYLHTQTARYREMMEMLFSLYQYRYAEEEKKKSVFMAKREGLPALTDALQAHAYEAYRIALRGIAHVVIPPSPDREDSTYNRLRKQIQEQEDQLLGILFSEAEFMRDIRSLYPYVKKLADITMDYLAIYQQLKQKQQVIDFDDMEHYALQILQANNGQVAALYRAQFAEIMVDEFQDSNDVQHALVMLICRPHNVFRVGDIKQSIYGFRHAKPQLMKQLMEARGEQDELIYLSHNYRSKKMIVDFNNHLFQRLMNIHGFSSRYEEADHALTGIPSQAEQNVPICFHAIFHDEIKKANELILSKSDLKASYIAHQILQTHKEQGRPWKDFVVLVRSNARKQNLKKVFDELHIPCFIDVKSGFYQSPAVQLMLSAMRALLHPHENIPFIALLRSPLFARSEQELAQVRLHKDHRQSYYAWYKEHPFPAFTHFLQLRKQVHTTPLCDMLEKLYTLQDYYEQHTSMQEKTNLDLLFDKAAAFAEQQATGIAGFLAHIEEIQDAQTAEAIPIGSEADVVRVMSIHQSKGLQFPIVFLWSNDQLTAIENKDFCMMDAECGIAMKYMELPQRFVRTTLPRIAMEHKKDREELEEEMRILYVATTRAQQELHIVDCLLSLEAYDRPLTMASVYERGGYTAWLLQTFLQEPSPLFTIREVHTLWHDEPLPDVQEKTIRMPRYAFPHEDIQLYSATTPKKAALPPFQAAGKNKGALYGTQMHKLIERLGQSVYDTKQIEQAAKALHMELPPHARQALKALYEHPLYQQAGQYPCYYELPFMVKREKEILHGYMDFVSIQAARIIIIDFKTDRIADEEELRTRYASQLQLYKEAMQLMYPQHLIETYIFSLHKGCMIAIG